MYFIIALHLSDALPSYPISLRAGFQQSVSDAVQAQPSCRCLRKLYLINEFQVDYD